MALTDPGTPLRASSVLTGSYVASSAVDTVNSDQVNLYCTYTKGDEASLQVKVETSPDGSTYFQQAFLSIAGGTATTTLGEYTFTATGNYLINVPVADAKLRIQAKATGGSPTGTLAVSAAEANT